MKKINIIILFLLFFTINTLGADDWFVSKNGNNTTGADWTTAWTELNQITWTSLSAGDTLYIDGGTTGMVYSTTMSVNTRGTSGNVVTISRSSESGHNGPVYLFPTGSDTAIFMNPANNLHDLKIDGLATNMFIIDGSLVSDTTPAIESWTSAILPQYNQEWCNMTLRYWKGGGFYIRSYSNGFFLHDLDLYDHGTNSATSCHQIRFDQTTATGSWHGNTISNVYCHNTRGINDCIETPSNVWIKNSIIYPGEAESTGSSADGIFCSIISGSPGTLGTHNVDISDNIFIQGSRTNQLIFISSGDSSTIGCMVSNIWVRNNIFYAINQDGFSFGVYGHARSTNSVVANVYIVNNSFYNIGTVLLRDDNHADPTKNCIWTNSLFQNNIIHQGTHSLNYHPFECETVIANGGCVGGYNYFCSDGPEGTVIMKWDGSDKTLAQVQDLGFELTSVSASNPYPDPTTIPSGLALNSTTSSAWQSGIQLNSLFTTDYDGNTRGTYRWDMGAFEYISGNKYFLKNRAFTSGKMIFY